MTTRSSRNPTATARRPAPAGPSPQPPADRLGSRPSWQQHLIAILLLWLALAAVYPEIALQGKIFASPDYESPSYFGAAGRAALRAGEYPLWNPYIFLGMPSYASLSFTPYVNPLSDLLAALGKLPLVPPLGWLLFYMIASGYGVFLLLRSLRVMYWAALLGGAAFMLQPHLASMGVFGHGSKLASAAFLPYLAWIALHLREPGRRLLWTGALSLACGLLLLRGHPQVAFYAFLLLALVGAVEIVGGLLRHAPRGELLRYAAGLAGGVLLGVGIAAVLLLPVRAYAPESIRGAGETGGATYQYATNWSLSPREIATFFVPSAMGFGEETYVGDMPFTNFPNYLGLAALLFGTAAVVLLRGRLLVTLAVVGGLSLLVSFGRHLSLVYGLFYAHMPYFNKVRVPVMILMLLQLACCVSLGLGLTALWGRAPRDLALRRPTTARDATRFAVAAAVLAVLLVVAVQPWSGALAARVAQNPRLPDQARATCAEVARKLLQGDGLRLSALALANAGIVLLLWRRKLPADVAGLALVALTVVDLGSVDRRMVSPQRTWPGLQSRVTTAPAAEERPSPLVQWLQARPREGAAPVRILAPGRGFMDNEWMRWGISSAGGYHPAKLARYESLVDTSRQTLEPELLDLFAVRYVVLPTRLRSTELQPAYEGPEGVVYENPRAQPRAWVTGRWQLLGGQACKEKLLSPGFDREREALLETAPTPAPDSSATGTARIAAFSANRLSVEVQSSAPALLVLAEAYSSGWKARVNGAPQPVLPADCVLRAVAVPAGASRVDVDFQDPTMRRGLLLTLLSSAAAVALLGWGAWQGRRARRTAGDAGTSS